MAMDMDRIRDEMAKLPKGSPIALVGDYATERVAEGCSVPQGKTLNGAFNAIRDYASAHRTGNCGVVSDADAFRIVDVYFGWPGRSLAVQETPEAKTVEETEPKEIKTEASTARNEAEETLSEEKAQTEQEPLNAKPQAPAPFALPDLGDLF